MSEIKNGGLHQYGAEPFEQQQHGTAGVERVKLRLYNISEVLLSTVPVPSSSTGTILIMLTW